MKQRFSSLDVKIIAHELSNTLCSLRLANVYDLSSRIFLLKFAKPNHKEQVVVDSGFRCHLTNFTRATATAPSAFVTRLRKFLKTRRVTSVCQVGTDRIIEFQFSDGQYRLFLEFYAGGNVVLTDRDLNILALLRIVSEGTEQEELRVGLKYSLERRQNFGGVPTLTKERVKNGLKNAVDKAQSEPAVQAKKSKKKAGDVLRKALSSAMTEFPPMLIEHALRVTSFDPETAIDKILSDEATFEKLMLSLQEAQKVINHLTSSETSKGYIIAKPSRSKAPQTDDGNKGDTSRTNVMYEDFHPFIPAQFQGIPDVSILEFDGFNKTVDEFFSSIEGQKLESRLTEREEHAKRKLETARQDHEKRLGGLQQVQELNVRRAQAIEANLQRVQEAIAAVNGLIAQGMDWVEVARLIEIEQARQNPVAEMIKLPLKLYENTITLLLAEDIFDDDDYVGDETDSDVLDSEDETSKGARPSKEGMPADKRLPIDVDLALSPWSNARQYYDQKKTAAVKEQKTLQSSTKALKSTERKINADLKRGLKQEKEVLRPVRKQHWFEKFYFFVSSDGYLVLGGKDTQQSEILYKKHLRKGDVYVHADLQGAASVIIKNNVGMSDSPIPPSTLSQAGTLSVTASNAWESKAIMAAWWVDSDQVSKTAPSGDYLSTGTFHVRGKKNFLPPAQLLLGFGIMFQVSEESKARHLKHRVRDVPDFSDSSTEVTQALGYLKAENSEDNGVSPGQDEHIDDNNDGEPSDEELQNSHPDLSEFNSTVASDSEDEDHAAVSEHENPLQTQGTAASTVETGEIDHSHNGSNDDELSGSEQSIGDDTSTHQASASETLTSGVRHMSAKERRLLRAGHDPATVSNPITPSAATNNPASQPQQLNNHSNASNKLASKPHVRGKHLKNRKLKTKYANQDDEDRALALRLLGSSTATQKTADDAALRAAKEAELAAQKQRRREQHARAAEKGLQEEDKRRAKWEGERINDDEAEEEETDLTIVDSFIGTPLPTDDILDALIICGPWDAIGSRCKYKAKLQPGTLKKGKAVREILGRWVEMGKKPREKGAEEEEERVRKREAELISQVRDVEVIGTVPVGRCRVVMGGVDRREGKAGVKGGKRGGRGSKRR